MRASWIATRHFPRRERRGLGILVALVLWIVAIAFIYALMQGQAQSGALGGVLRVTALETVLFAGQSALAEAGHVLRHPPTGAGTVLDAIRDGRQSGLAHDPQATRDLYAKILPAGRLTISPVTYEVAHRPAAKDIKDPWLIDLVVRVSFDPAGSGATALTRELRHRHTGRLCAVTETLGPQQGKVVFSALYIWGDPLLEEVAP